MDEPSDLWSTSIGLLSRNRNTISTIAATLGFAVIGGYFYFANLFSYWKRLGVPGPKPYPLFGNTKQLIKAGREQIEIEWVKKFGKLYGIYYGSNPRLVVADLDVVNQICIKDFDAFTDHYTSEFFNKYTSSFLIYLKGDHWKRVRAFMSPTFTSGKIKRMFKMLDLCADDLIEYVNQEELRQKGPPVLNGKELFNLFTMDAITTCCYSLKLERADSPNLKSAANRNEFVKIAMSLFTFNFLRILVATTLPKFILRFFKFEISPEKHLMPMVNILEKMIEKRRSESNSKKYDDYLQMLIEAKLDDKIELNEMDNAENHHAGLTSDSILQDQARMVEQVKNTSHKDKKKIDLSDLEIITNASLLLVVGLETTGNLLGNATYLLSHYPEIQQKLYEELEKIVDRDEQGNCSFSYDSLTSCKYLDAFISETLRTHSPPITGDRCAGRDYYIKKYDLTIPKGMVVHIPYHAIMNDPENFEEPDKFDPERFLGKRAERIKPGSYNPFGLGPRHCIGMRFSLTESKLALAKMMMHYKFEPAPDCKFPPDSDLVIGLLRVLKDPRVKFVRRQEDKL